MKLYFLLCVLCLINTLHAADRTKEIYALQQQGKKKNTNYGTNGTNTTQNTKYYVKKERECCLFTWLGKLLQSCPDSDVPWHPV